MGGHLTLEPYSIILCPRQISITVDLKLYTVSMAAAQLSKQ